MTSPESLRGTAALATASPYHQPPLSPGDSDPRDSMPTTPETLHVRSASASSVGSGALGEPLSGGKTAQYAQLTQVGAGLCGMQGLGVGRVLG